MRAGADGNSATPRLELKNITKAYPSVVANDDVSLTVMPGEIHAVLGENGAGKSTLMKIIYGVTKADGGQIFFNGEPVAIANPAEARRLGVAKMGDWLSPFFAVTAGGAPLDAGPVACGTRRLRSGLCLGWNENGRPLGAPVLC